MTLIVFAGPSLPPAARAGITGADVEWQPPARQGDVYRAARRQPAAIGLIDGLFETTLSVWHKEILWALERGIDVWGAASMGALRAAELHPFGMRGIGTIFTDYRDGLLVDDAEVAVSHGPADAGWVTLTEATVNVRATVQAAVLDGVLDRDFGRELIRLAEATFFKDRTWNLLLGNAAVAKRERFLNWLPTGRVNQKRDDALAMIGAFRAHEAQVRPHLSREWKLVNTVAWDTALEKMNAVAGIGPQMFVEHRDSASLSERLPICLK